jgi:hypothetical protein
MVTRKKAQKADETTSITNGGGSANEKYMILWKSLNEISEDTLKFVKARNLTAGTILTMYELKSQSADLEPVEALLILKSLEQVLSRQGKVQILPYTSQTPLDEIGIKIVNI